MNAEYHNERQELPTVHPKVYVCTFCRWVQGQHVVSLGPKICSKYGHEMQMVTKARWM